MSTQHTPGPWTVDENQQHGADLSIFARPLKAKGEA